MKKSMGSALTEGDVSDEDRCTSVYNPGTWPYAKRCESKATTTTESGSRRCDDHKDWDD